MNKIKTITVNGSTYQVSDPAALSFAEEQVLSEEQKARARENIGAVDDGELADIRKKMKYSHISGETVTLQNGYFIYTNCEINAIPNETVLTGEHVFKDCKILGTLFIKGGAYAFHNCTFKTVKIVGATAKFYGCTGENINGIGNCPNSVIDGCTLISTAWAPVIFSGGNSLNTNIRIANNTLINNPPTGDFVYESVFQTQCINTHGVSYSVIENNYCKKGTMVDTNGVAWGDTAIDISGHSETPGEIRASNNVVRNNIIEGDGGITIYCAKDIVCSGNTVSDAIRVSGFNPHDGELDFGKIFLQGNTCRCFLISLTGETITKVFITGNVVMNGVNSGTSIAISQELPEKAEVYYANNTQDCAIGGTTAQYSRLSLPEEMVYIPANTRLYIPTCYVVKSEISTVPTGTFFNGGLVSNDTALDRYIIYRKCNIYNGERRLWTQ